MKVVISNYSTDGSSLSEDRCQQICQVYDLCSHIGKRFTTYRDIQEAAVSEHIFGAAKADSVIRTIFPLLKKIGFVAYSDTDEFMATSFFTDLGKSFILTIKALDQAKILNEKTAIDKVKHAIEMIIQLGIVNLSNSDYRNHGILLAIEILRIEEEIYWNEFLYILSIIQKGGSISEAIKQAKSNRISNEIYEYVNKKGSEIKTTSYTYIRSFLGEAGIIASSKGPYSKLNSDARAFIKSLPHYGYK